MKKIGFIFLLCFIFFHKSNEVSASDMDIAVEANIPENQIDKNQSYFDLRMKPGGKQEISMNVINSSDEVSKIQVEPHVAFTNNNGEVDYSKKNIKNDPSLIYDLTKMIEGETRYTLQPKEKREISFTINMPDKEFDGMLLGGIYVQKINESENENKKKKIQIANTYAYVIGIKLTENDNPILPELLLHDVRPSLENYRNVVKANIQNTKPVIINNLTIETEVNKKGSKEILKKEKKEAMTMAPQSNFDFPISWGNKEFSPGKYELNLKATIKDGESWSYKKEFVITAVEAKKLNNDAVDLENKKDYSLWYILIASLIFVLIIVLFIAIKYHKKK